MSIYRSPNTSPDQFTNELLIYFQATEKNDLKNEIKIFAGHINLDLTDSDKWVEEYKNNMNSFGFVSYINSYTRLQSKTCLNHYLS